MKSKILAILMVAFSVSYSQNIGSNGTNVPENLTAEVRGYISEIWPAGKPYEFRVRQDKDPLTDQMINNLLELDYLLGLKGSWLDITFTFNTRPFGAEDLKTFDKLVNLNFNIVAAEMGNEEFATVAGHLSAQDFYNKCKPIIDSLNKRGFTGKILFPIAPRPTEVGSKHGGRNVQSLWNNYMATVINSNPQFEPVFHIYANQNEAPALSLLSREKLPEANDYNSFFRDLVNQVTADDLIPVTMTYAATKFPDKKIWITEMGYVVSVGNLSNTFGFELCRLWALEQLEQYDNIEAVFIHSGPNTNNTGFISERKRQDLPGSPYIKRLGYFVLDLYLNKTGEFAFNTSDLNGKFINATEYDQSAGWCEWWLSLPASYELGEYSTKSGALSFGYQFDKPACDTISKEIITFDTITVSKIVYDTIITPFTVYNTSVIVNVFPRVVYSLTIDNNFNDIGRIYYNKIDTINWIEYIPDTTFSSHIEFDTLIKSKIIYSQLITSDTIYETVIDCDTIVIPIDTTPKFQELDADTLIFNNEIEFRDFLFHYGLSVNYEVLPPTFDQTQTPEDVLPFKFMNWDFNGVTYKDLWTVDPAYYIIPNVNENEAYLHEEGFAGKRFVMIYDHSALAKNYRMWLTIGEKCGDYRYVDDVITNLTTGQVAIFKNAWNWSDRNGEHIFNNNLKTWQLWGEGRTETTQRDIQNRMPTNEDSNCQSDFSHSDILPGHETTDLRFQMMNEVYGYLKQ